MSYWPPFPPASSRLDFHASSGESSAPQRSSEGEPSSYSAQDDIYSPAQLSLQNYHDGYQQDFEHQPSSYATQDQITSPTPGTLSEYHQRSESSQYGLAEQPSDASLYHSSREPEFSLSDFREYKGQYYPSIPRHQPSRTSTVASTTDAHPYYRQYMDFALTKAATPGLRPTVQQTWEQWESAHPNTVARTTARTWVSDHNAEGPDIFIGTRVRKYPIRRKNS